MPEQVKFFGHPLRRGGFEVLLVGVLSCLLYHERVWRGMGEQEVRVLGGDKVASLCPLWCGSTRSWGVSDGLSWLKKRAMDGKSHLQGPSWLKNVQKFKQEVEGLSHVAE